MGLSENTNKSCAEVDFAKILKCKAFKLFRFNHTKKWAAMEAEGCGQHGS